jgi:hypothetical protein
MSMDVEDWQDMFEGMLTIPIAALVSLKRDRVESSRSTVDADRPFDAFWAGSRFKGAVVGLDLKHSV